MIATTHARTHHRHYTAALSAFLSIFAYHQALADDTLCTSPEVSALTLDVVKAQEQDIEGAGIHYTNIILSLSRDSSNALLKMTSQNIGGLFGYCIGEDAAGSAGYIKSPFPLIDSSGVGLAHMVIDRTRFDPGELLKKLNSKAVMIKAVVAKRDEK